MLLMAKVVERVEVARSFARLAAGIVTLNAARATVQLRAVADQKIAETIEREGGLRSRYGRALEVARAARDAAIHVATHRPKRGRAGSGAARESAPETNLPDDEAAPETAPAPETETETEETPAACG